MKKGGVVLCPDIFMGRWERRDFPFARSFCPRHPEIEHIKDFCRAG